MRRVSRYMSGILICLGLTASIVCATFWRRTLRSMDSIQFITAAGTAYSMDTEPHSVSVVLQTHYLEYIRANNLDWFEPSTPGWSFKAIQYQVDYERPERPTIPVAQVLGSNTVTATYDDMDFVSVSQAPWNRRSLGFNFKSGSLAFGSRHVSATIPLWFLMLIGVTPSLIWLRQRLRQRRRRRRNLCLACGYSRTGNISGICPECGTAWALA